MRKFDRYIWILVALVFAIIMVVNNGEDWDHFLSFFETDLRSWLLDGKPPVWTYQLCGGVTRLGDPQAFGLSPLFLPILVFGSFWGAKILLIGCTLAGFLYFARILVLLWPELQEWRDVAWGISGFFFFSDYFLWHLSVGHLAFALIPFAMVPVFYLLEGGLRGFTFKNSALFVLSAVAYCTAGVYHSLVFFIFPAVLTSAVVLALSPGSMAKMRSWRRLPSVMGVGIGLISLALLLAAYKWKGVLDFQRLHPRTLNENFSEALSIGNIAMDLGLPTWGHRFLGVWELDQPWRIHEYAAFSLLSWIVLALTVIGLRAPSSRRKWREWVVWGTAFALIVDLVMADGAPIPLFRWMNQGLFHGSLRAPGRFQGTLLGILAFALAELLSRSREKREVFRKYVIPLGAALTILNLLSFWPQDGLDSFKRIRSLKYDRVQKMQKIVWGTDPAPGTMSEMYASVLAGEIVLNCYQPLAHSPLMSTEESRKAQDGYLIRRGSMPVSQACAESVYLTQSEIFADRALCPPDLCLNVADILLPAPLRYDPKRELFCLVPSISK